MIQRSVIPIFFRTLNYIVNLFMHDGRISKTAAFIAIKLYGLTRYPKFRSLFDEETILFYDRLVRYLPSPLNRFHSALKSLGTRRFFMFFEELLLPGDLMHILLRKYCLNKEAEQLLRGGIGQAVVLGSGFDHLAVQMAEKNIKSLEVDTPHMIGIKKAFADRYGYNHPLLSFKPTVVNRDPASFNQILGGMDREISTLVIAEGFFDYMERDQAEALLYGLKSWSKNSIHLVSTFFALDELNAFHRFIFRAGVRLAGEKIRLDSSLDEFRRMAENNGLILQNVIPGQQMKRDLPESPDIDLSVLNGFYLLHFRG